VQQAAAKSHGERLVAEAAAGMTIFGSSCGGNAGALSDNNSPTVLPFRLNSISPIYGESSMFVLKAETPSRRGLNLTQPNCK
jgi:hypothetical protein